MRAQSLFVLFGLALSSAVLAQDAPYPVFETDFLPPAEFHARRERLKKELGPGAMAVFFTNPVQVRNNDVDFQFRADSNFLYLTGFDEPDAALMLVPDGFDMGNGKRVTEVLFLNVSDQMSLTWLGYRMGPNNAVRLLGVEAALPNVEFGKTLQLAAASFNGNGKRLAIGWIPSDANGGLARMTRAFQDWKAGAGFESGANTTQIVRRMREIKSPAEIQLIKKATEISVLGHLEAMRSIEPGMREYEIGWLVQYVFGRFGCEYTGYPPICGAGPNSTILHYNTNRKRMESGEIMCMDTAGEYHGYTADVTRSFPVNGKFTPEQRAIYLVVQKAQEIGIEACRSGNTFSQIEQKIQASMAADMIKLGIIGNAGELRRYYMHGFGHGLGLDVHDPAPRTLAPGAVLTVEPGIYIKEGSPCDKKWWNIGIRIEDDIVVTEGDPINLSAGAPRDIDKIEALMREKGIGNVPVRGIG
jgi:Xaa-Pro aminopeptidase